MHFKPNTDNHVHLRGAISKEIVFSLLDKYKDINLFNTVRKEHKDFLFGSKHLTKFFKAESSTDDKVKSVFSFSNLFEFFASYLVTAYIFREKEDLLYLINSVADSFIDQDIIRADMIVSPYQYLVTNQLTLKDILSSLSEFDSDKLKINWVIDPVRDKGEEFCIKHIEDCFEIAPNLFKAINLGGSEDLFPANQFKKLYKRSDELGLELRMHAGETGRVDNLEYAVKELGCKRIGHGISVVKDKELLSYFERNGIELEICISSNVRLSGYTVKDYPIREIVDAGVKVFICTDDPGFLETDLEKEFSFLKDFGFKENEVDLLVQTVNS